MIKLPLPLRHSAAVAVAFTALCGLSASAASLDSWIGYTPANPPNTRHYQQMDTNHPVIGDGTAGSIGGHILYSASPTYTLGAVGDSLSFSGNANLQGVTAAQADQFRFGVYNSNGTATGDKIADISGWLGYFATNAGGGTGDQRGRLWKRPSPNTGSFGSNAPGSADRVAWSGASGMVMLSGDYSFSMVLTRTADGLNIAWSLTGISSGSNYSMSGHWLDTDPNTFTFDRVGFFVGGGLNAEQMSFSDLDMTFSPAVPEPATTAALLGLIVVGALLLRRRAKRV